MSKTATLNQVRHLYISNGSAVATPTGGANPQHLTSANNWGDIAAYKTMDNEIFLEYKSAEQTVLRSDLIDPNTISQFVVSPAWRQRRPVSQYKVEHDSNLTGTDAPVNGQAYHITVQFRQVLSISDASIYDKDVFVVGRGQTYSDLFLEMAGLLQASVDRDPWQFADVYVTSGNTKTKVEVAGMAVESSAGDGAFLAALKGKGYNGTYDGIVVKEHVNRFEQGLHEDKPVYFEIFAYEIEINSVKKEWAKITNQTLKNLENAVVYDGSNDADATAVGNGRGIAELEWFTTSLRGENDKGMYWPDVVKTYYKTALDVEGAEYDTVDIHFHKTLSQGSVQKAEKQLTIAVPKQANDTTGAAGQAVADAIADAITAAGGNKTATVLP